MFLTVIIFSNTTEVSGRVNAKFSELTKQEVLDNFAERKETGLLREVLEINLDEPAAIMFKLLIEAEKEGDGVGLTRALESMVVTAYMAGKKRNRKP